MISEYDLRHMYWEDEMSLNEIAKCVSVSHVTVRNWMKKYEIEIRTISEARLIGSRMLSEDELQRMYWDEYMSQLEIAESIGVTQYAVGNWMKLYGIDTRTQSEAISMENHPSWQGGISFEPYCYKFNNAFKEDVRERDNYICQLCECTQESNGRKLDVHHIHYDKENCYPDVVALCCSCNSRVNSNRDYWESYFENQLLERGLLGWSISA